jgi:hypothetical protein
MLTTIFRRAAGALATALTGTALLLAALLPAGCTPSEEEQLKALKFRSALYFELAPSMVTSFAVSAQARDIYFPITKRRFRANGYAQIADDSFLSAEPAKVGPRDAPVPGIVIRLNERAARAFNIAAMSLLRDGTPHVFLRVNNDIVGVHTVRAENFSGDLFFHMEGLEAADANELAAKVRALCRDLNTSIVVLRKITEARK